MPRWEAAKRGELDLSLAMVDSTVVRAHQHAAVARKKAWRQPGGARPSAGTQPWRSEHEDARGECKREPRAWHRVLTGGQAGDTPVGEEMLGEVLTRAEVKTVGADRAYDSDAIRALIAAAGKEAIIPPRSNRRGPACYDREKYKERNKAERLFCRLKGYRAVATRYDKLASMFLGGVLASLLAISLKCIVNRP